MTEATWRNTVQLLGHNLDRFQRMASEPPAPRAKFCRESPHRTLGHLTACQAAWLPVMRHLRNGDARAVIPINPDPLFRKMHFNVAPWQELLGRFESDRAEWRQILAEIDPTRQTQSMKRTWSAQTLTKRMVDHEHRHLDDLQP